MTSRTSFGAAIAAACLAAAGGAAPAVPDTYEAHLARAAAIAGEEYRPMLRQCTRFAAPAPPRGTPGAAPPPPQPAHDPAKVFDNLYRLGFDDVQMWVVNTSAGIILIDALNNAHDAEFAIVPGLRRLGLDPARIKYIVVTHGHGDHYGGAGWLVDHYQPRVLMSEADWQLFDRPQAGGPAGFSPPPKRDMTIVDGQTLTLGDTTIEFKLTPGHTLGTVSVLIPVKLGGAPHMAAIWGGTGFNFAPSPERFATYAASTETFRTYIARRGVDAMLSNHAENDKAIDKIAAMRANPSGRNPFLVGPASADHFLTVLGECALANRARMLAGLPMAKGPAL